MSAEIENYAIIKDGKVYQKTFLNYPEREVGEINDDDKTIEFYSENFNKFKSEVDELISKINLQENKGSFLSYLENLKNQLSLVEGVGDFESIFKLINKYEVNITTQIRVNRERNLSVKRAFIDELKELLKTEDISLVADRIKDIKGKWIRVGALDKDFQEELQSQFETLIDSFFEKYNEVIGKDLKLYQELVNESIELANSENLQSSRKRIIEIQKEWKLLPNIPKNEYVPLFKKLRETHDAFFKILDDKQSLIKNSKNAEEQKRGVKEKKDLINKVKNLLKTIDSKSIKDLKDLQLTWKNSSRVKGEDNNKLWDEFSALGDEFFEKKTLDMQVSKRKITGEVDILKFKIKLMKDAIFNEKKKLQTVEDNLGSFRLNISSKKIENMFTNQDKSGERKIEVKNKILAELKDSLNGLESKK